MRTTIAQPFVGLISRPKLSGIGRHAGVLLPNGHVAHMTPDGQAIVTLNEFAQGRSLTYEKEVPLHRHQQVQLNAFQSIGGASKYDLLNRNCEHYATWLLGEEPQSAQVTAVAALTLIGVLAAMTA